MDTSTKVGLSLSFALFIVIIILIIFMTWSYYSVFQKDSYFFDLVGPSVCNPPCQNDSLCIPNYGCVCSPDYYGADCSKVVLPDQPTQPDQPTNVLSNSPSDTVPSSCDDFIKKLENKLPEYSSVLNYFQDATIRGLPDNTCHELNVFSNAIPDIPTLTYSDYYGEPKYKITYPGGFTPPEQDYKRTCEGVITSSNIYKRSRASSDYPVIAYTEFNCFNFRNPYFISNDDQTPLSHLYRYENLDLETKVCKRPAIGFHGHTIPNDNNIITDLHIICPDDEIPPKSDDPNLSQFSFTCPNDTILLGFGHDNNMDLSQPDAEYPKPRPVYLSNIRAICGKNPLS